MKHKNKAILLLLLFFSHQTMRPAENKAVVIMSGVLCFAIEVATLGMVVSLLRAFFFEKMCQYNCHRFVRIANPHNLPFGDIKFVDDNKAFRIACLSKSKETIVELFNYTTVDVYETLRWVIEDNKNKEITQLFIELINRNYRPIRCSLEWAVKNNAINVMKELLRDPCVSHDDLNFPIHQYPGGNDNISYSLISWAARYGYREIVELLLNDKRVDPNRVWCCTNPLLEAVHCCQSEVLALLLKNPRVNKKGEWFALHSAISQGWLDGIKQIIPFMEVVKEKNNVFFKSISETKIKNQTEFARTLRHRYKINSLANFYMVTRGDFNKRNMQGLRPLDITHQWYLSKVIKHNQNKDKKICKGKKSVYFQLLQVTPALPPESLQSALVKHMPLDLSKKIIRVYLGLCFPEDPRQEIDFEHMLNKKQITS